MTRTREENAADLAREEEHQVEIFKQTFGDGGSFVCVGDTITAEHEGFTFTARIEQDCDYTLHDDDVHNVEANPEHAKEINEAIAAFERDEWFYGGVVVSVEKAGVKLDDHAASLWGMEINYPGSDNGHLNEVANELINEALTAGRAKVYELTRV